MRKLGLFGVALAFAAALLIQPSAADARKIFINKVDLDAIVLKDVTFKGCQVHLDSDGNIYVKAPGYKIQVPKGTKIAAKPAAAKGTVGSPNDRYYLVSFFNRREATQYDIEIMINKRLVRRIRHYHNQVAMDVTKFIKRGEPNEVVFVARKNLNGKPRISLSKLDYFRIVIGSGFESKGQVVLKNSLVETKRNASESDAVLTQRFVLTFR